MKNELKNLKAELPTLDKKAQVVIKGGTAGTPPPTVIVIDDVTGF